ncbi:hypothetical protein RRG08_032384 [Elysia crispata]|uniref:Uncharacterized protein n=1 Tax=Elysia crispata TaxID=231223 RepID=A0AAE1AH03_9GAST|nr:hypothetical protein RRG08_032384 [Elysia crispata]
MYDCVRVWFSVASSLFETRPGGMSSSRVRPFPSPGPMRHLPLEWLSPSIPPSINQPFNSLKNNEASSRVTASQERHIAWKMMN